MRIVDAHAHVFLQASEEYPRATHDIFPAERSFPVERYLEVMDAHGVSHAVLVALSEHDRYLAEVLAAHRDRFAGVAVHPQRAAIPVAEHRERVARTGVTGLRLFSLGDARIRDVSELPVYPVLAAMADAGETLWYYAAADQMPLLRRILERLPHLRVLLNHLGFAQSGFERDEHQRPRIGTAIPPPTLETACGLARFPDVHVMCSGAYAFSQEPYPYLDVAPVAQRLADAFGTERLLWASDAPWVLEAPGYQGCVDLVDAHLPGLGAGERAAVLGGNAARLFGFPDPAPAPTRPSPSARVGSPPPGSREDVR